MPLIQSILKLTHDYTGSAGSPRVLLDFDWWMDGPLKFPQKNGMEVIPTQDSAYPLILDTLNSQFTMKFTVIDESAASKTASMVAVLNGLISVAAMRTLPLKIEVKGHTPGKFWRVEQCKLGEFEPWHDPNAKTLRNVRGITLTCSGISYI